MKNLSIITTALTLLTGSASAQMIVNQNYESTPGTGSNSFASWNESEKTVGNFKDAASVVTDPTLVLEGNTSAQINKDGNAWFSQIIANEEQTTNFSYSFSFAVFDPGAADASADRGLNLLLRSTSDYTSANMLNLIVTDDGNGTDASGKIQLYNGSSWDSVSGLTVNFSTDTNDNGIFDNGDIVATNTMTIIGNYDASPSYTITLNGSTSTELNDFQGAAPVSTTLKRVVFQTGSSSNGYLVDSIPEPSSYALLIGMTGLSFAACTRRKRA